MEQADISLMQQLLHQQAPEIAKAILLSRKDDPRFVRLIGSGVNPLYAVALELAAEAA